MGHISSVYRARVRHKVRLVIHTLLALGLLFSAIPAPAQQPAPQELLRQLLEIPELRGGPAGLGAAVGEADALDALPADGPAGGERVTSKLDQAQLIIVRRFCEGRLGATQSDLLALVPEFSPLEQDYCQRAGSTLLQFGYDVFDGFQTPQVLVHGAIPDDYRLGIGDEINLTFRGQVTGTSQVAVDREGRVILDNLAPVTAAGRTFGEFRDEIKARVDAAFVGTEVFVSLGATRKIAVSVTGEVRSPGVHQLNGLSTIYDAVSMAGGIKKTGSLRRVVIFRDGGSFELDIYDLLTGGSIPEAVMLFEGDRIVIPTLGRTIAVSGKVIRPAIYELSKDETSISLNKALGLAGGALRPSGYRISQVTFDENGRVLVVEVTDKEQLVAAGDLIDVRFGNDVEVGTVVLAGNVQFSGRRSRNSAPTISALVGGPDGLKDGTYTPFAVLETTDESTRAKRLFGINLQKILAGEIDYALKDGDKFTVFSMEDIQFLTSPNVVAAILKSEIELGEKNNQQSQEIKQIEQLENQVLSLTQQLDKANQRIAVLTEGAGLIRQKTGEEIVDDAMLASINFCQGIKSLSVIASTAGTNRFASIIQAAAMSSVNIEDVSNPELEKCPAVFQDSVDMLPYVLGQVVILRGEILLPGAYPIVDSTSLTSVVSLAGGVTGDADLTRVEITKFTSDQLTGVSRASRGFSDLSNQLAAEFLINPGDIVRFNPLFTDRESGPVLLTGEFVRPGYYDIRRGETLSELMARAGGLTEQAYPYGAVFTRESVKKAERDGFLRAARELDAAAVSAAARQDVDAGAVASMREITAQIAAVEPVGRVVIEADPAVLQVRTDLDVVLQPGDTIFIPKRPNSILVIGDVLSPGAQQFLPGTKAERYIEQAGGFQDSADENRVYLVYPNGVAYPLSKSMWTYSNVQIPPGSTIVAPKDPAPFDLVRLSTEVATVVSQIAVTLASLAVITD